MRLDALVESFSDHGLMIWIMYLGHVYATIESKHWNDRSLRVLKLVVWRATWNHACSLWKDRRGSFSPVFIFHEDDKRFRSIQFLL